MAFYLVVAIMGIALSATLIPTVITQDRTTRLDTTRVHALDAAQAGVDVAVGRIRAARTGTGGETRKLPCGPMAGTVSGAGPAAYDVTIGYYTVDPVTGLSPTLMRCVDGYGTYAPASGNSTPSYARIRSVGTDGPAVNGSTRGRTLVTTYVFKTQNGNIPGGVVRLYPASGSSSELCMDAGSSTPNAGTSLLVQTCSSSNPPVAQQVFAYRTDLTLQLLSSVTTATPKGMCLDTAAPPTQGSPITLRECGAGPAPTYTQQWSYNDNGHYQAANANGTLTSSPALCMNVASQSPALPVTLEPCNGSIDDPHQAWIPSPLAGAGMAASFKKDWGGTQWVNYAEFGRCLDITGQKVNSPSQIDYPCKQSPDQDVRWNQLFTMPDATATPTATGRVSTIMDGTTYCLTSPAVDGGYPKLEACSDTDPRQSWKRFGGDPSLNYSQRYTVVDSNGLCLGLIPMPSDWSRIDVEQCTGALEHKWNANPNLTKPFLKDTREEATSASPPAG